MYFKHQRLCILCVVLLCMHVPLFAQSSFDVKYAQDVFNKLIRTINQSSPPRPVLEVVPDPNVLAITSGNGRITIGYTLVDKCRSFGKDSSNAIAHVLSHELTHYYQNHFWSEQFGSAYADVSWGEQMQQSGKSLNVMRMYETQADEYGMYYAFASGYRTLYMGDKVLDSIYTWFHLNDEIPGYPSLTERKQIAVEARTNIAKLIPLFESANMCLTLAQMLGGNNQILLAKTAALQYDDILARKMQTKEMYNNAAIARMLSVLPLLPDSIQRLQYPFMLEAGSVLYRSDRSRSATGETDPVVLESMNTAIDEALVQLNAAIKLDKQFYPAWLNLAILHVIRGEYGSATDALQNASRNMGAQHPMLYVIDEMRAIIAHANGDDESMTKLFSAATKGGSMTADYNFMALQTNEIVSSINTSAFVAMQYATDTTELYHGEQIFNLLDKMTPNRNGRFDLLNEQLVLYTDTTNEYISTYLRANFKPSFNKLRFMTSTDNPANSTSSGIRKGDGIQEVVAQYGAPQSVILESRGEIYAYPAQNLFIYLSDDHVTKWVYWWMK